LLAPVGATGGAVILAAGDRLGVFLAKAHPLSEPVGQGITDLSLAGNAAWFSGASDPTKLRQ